MMTSKWISEEDVSRDIQDLSVFGPNGYSDKDSILSHADEIRTRLQRTRRSCFDDDEKFNEDSTICENVTYCKPVRGRPLKDIPPDNRPGGKCSFLDNQNETCVTIRKAGFDFSNDIIENTLRQVNKQRKNDAPCRETFVMPNIRFNSSNTKSNSTTASSSSSTSPTFPSQHSLINNKEIAEDNCMFVPLSPIEVDNIKKKSVPPPLFEIIKSKSRENNTQEGNNNCCKGATQIYQDKRKKEIVQSVNKTNSKVMTGVILETAKEHNQRNSVVNLLCEKNFPPL